MDIVDELTYYARVASASHNVCDLMERASVEIQGLRNKLTAAERDRDQWKEHAQDLIDSYGQECCCGYDNPDDICVGHSKNFRELKNKLTQAERDRDQAADAIQRLRSGEQFEAIVAAHMVANLLYTEETRIKEELDTQKCATQHAIDHAESYKEEVEFLRTLLKKRDAGEHCYWCYADQGTECTCYHDAVQDYFKRVTINAPD